MHFKTRASEIYTTQNNFFEYCNIAMMQFIVLSWYHQNINVSSWFFTQFKELDDFVGNHVVRVLKKTGVLERNIWDLFSFLCLVLKVKLISVCTCLFHFSKKKYRGSVALVSPSAHIFIDLCIEPITPLSSFNWIRSKNTINISIVLKRKKVRGCNFVHHLRMTHIFWCTNFHSENQN